MHAQLPRCTALIAIIFLQHGQDESFLELANGFRIKNAAPIHLHNQRFQLIFHGSSLSLAIKND